MEYWYLWVILAVLCIITVFVLIKASASGKLQKIDREREMSELKRLRELKTKFTSFDKATADNTDARTLLDGVCVVMQARIEKSENPEKEFLLFSKPQKLAYTLNYLVEDSEPQVLSFFFKNNGEPLVSLAAEALSAVGEDRASVICEDMFAMFDENNEKVSLDVNETERLDNQFFAVIDFSRLLSEIKSYIIDNIDDFQ